MNYITDIYLRFPYLQLSNVVFVLNTNAKYVLYFHPGKSSVAFGTTLDRELLPLKVPPTRFGNQLRIPRAPALGPGRYENNEVMKSFKIYVN